MNDEVLIPVEDDHLRVTQSRPHSAKSGQVHLLPSADHRDAAAKILRKEATK